MEKEKIAVETMQGAIAAAEDVQTIRALNDLELVLAGGGGDAVIDWGP